MKRVVMSLEDHLHGVDRPLVHAFFAEFAAAEYRLKAAGFIRSSSDDAQADWAAYAHAIQQRFRSRKPQQTAKAWRFLSENPPRKQVVRKKALAWAATERPNGASDAEYGLLLVRRVRNNLFHGGKFFHVAGTDQHARDRDLVSAALEILTHAMDLMPCGRE